MAQGDSADLATMEAKGAPPQETPSNPFLAFINKLLNKIQQQDIQKEKGEIGVREESVERVDVEEVEVSRNNSKPDVVKFPLTQPEVPPLKVENEDAEKDTNPIALWQVYALGGFIVMRWVWAKWQERRAKNKKDNASSEENPPAEDGNSPAEED